MKKGGSTVAKAGLARPTSRQAGFTIVETLIVLAITGALFFSASVLISGKQNKSEFTRGMNDLQQQIQQIMNETASGYYPDAGSFKCVSGSPSFPVISAGPKAQGTNAGCLFMGKAIQFGTDDPSQLGVFALAGNQYNGGITPVANLTQARPRAIYPASSSEGSIPTDVYETAPMEYGLTVATNSNAINACGATGMCYGTSTTPSTTKQTGVLAFVAADQSGNLATSKIRGGASTNETNPGSLQLSLYAVKNGPTNQTPMNASTTIGNNVVQGLSGLDAASWVRVCVVSGGTDQSGLFTIDSGLNVTLKIYGGKTC